MDLSGTSSAIREAWSPLVVVNAGRAIGGDGGMGVHCLK